MNATTPNKPSLWQRLFGAKDHPQDHGMRLPWPAAIARDREAFATAVELSTGVAFHPGHAVEIFDNGHVFDALIEAIAQAEHSVRIVMYIWDDGEVSRRMVGLLRRKAEAGVRCELVVDAMGSAGFVDTIGPELAAAGCAVRIFRPMELSPSAPARNHRKLVIVDDRLAFTGGFAFRDEWDGDGRAKDEWRDVAIRFTGPAVVDALYAFYENWHEGGGELSHAPTRARLRRPQPGSTPSATGAEDMVTAALFQSAGNFGVTPARRVSQAMFAAAAQRLWIANAYFVPTEDLMELLCEQARAGVDVRILTAGANSDSKASFAAQQLRYPRLLAAGVRIWEYQPSI